MKYILGLEVERINCPVVIRFGDSVTRVEDGGHLRDVDFEKPFVEDSVNIVDGNKLEIRLVEQKILDTAWTDGQDVSFF